MSIISIHGTHLYREKNKNTYLQTHIFPRLLGDQTLTQGQKHTEPQKVLQKPEGWLHFLHFLLRANLDEFFIPNDSNKTKWTFISMGNSGIMIFCLQISWGDIRSKIKKSENSLTFLAMVFVGNYGHVISSTLGILGQLDLHRPR